MYSKSAIKKIAAFMAVSTLCSAVFSAFPAFAADEDSGLIFSDTFESGASDWTGRGAASVSASKKEAHGGSGSLFVTSRSQSWNGATKSLSSDFVAGNKYSFSGYARYAGSGSATFKMTLQYTDSSSTTQYPTIAEADSTDGWVHLENTSYTIPSDATDISLYFETAEGTGDFYIDDVTAVNDPSNPKPPKPVPFVLGDMTKDGELSAADLSAIKQAALAEKYDSATRKYGDVNQSGKVNELDVNMMRDFLLGKVSKFEKGEPDGDPITGPQEYEKSYNFPAVSALKATNEIADPFIFQDGSKVESPDDWWRRQAEISCMYEYYMYGVWRDGSDEEVSYDISGNKLKITVKRKSTGKTASFTANVSLPSKVRHEGGAPVVVGMHTNIQEKVATGNGYAVITTGDMMSNFAAADNNQHTGPFYTLYPYGRSWEEQTGVLMAWGWGCSKVLDALYAGAAEELNINPDSSIVTGVSRWGKAAAVCGAYDKRFKMVAPSCSGAGGLAMYRYRSVGKTYDFTSKGGSGSYKYSENEALGNLQASGEQGWFNGRFMEFRAENQLPMDQHMLASLCADPNRYLFIICSCQGEDWVNAPAQWMSYLGVKHVFDYLDLSDHLAINVHLSGHAVIEEDMKYMMAYFDQHVYGIQSKLDLSNLTHSPFELPKNKDPFADTFAKNWLY